MSKLTAWFQSHQKQALAGGAAGAVALGLYARKKKAGASSPVMSSIGGGKTVIAPATYDSTASDLYNSIEPLIENLQNQISALGQTASTPATAVTPTVVTPAADPGTASPAAAPPSVPQVVAQAPTGAQVASIIGVAVPAPSPGPALIAQLPNPITGQTGNIAVGYGATPFIYGGTQAQVDQLIGNPNPAPAPATPVSWGGRGGWDDPHYSW